MSVSQSERFFWKNKLEPCTTRNKPATKIDMEAEDVETYPDAYQWERAKRVAHRTVGDALKRLAISRNTKTPKSR